MQYRRSRHGESAVSFADSLEEEKKNDKKDEKKEREKRARSILDYAEKRQRGREAGGRVGGKRACISGRGRPVSLTLQLFAAAHPFRRGLSIPRNLLRTKVGEIPRGRERDSALSSVRPSDTPACRNRTDGRTNGRMVGREFHTKHNPHIETQTQWPRQVGRGAVLPAWARVRELYPRVCAHIHVCDLCLHIETCAWREKERKSEEERWAHAYVCTRVHMVERCTYGVT